jgi:hypothetical protein
MVKSSNISCGGKKAVSRPSRNEFLDFYRETIFATESSKWNIVRMLTLNTLTSGFMLTV